MPEPVSTAASTLAAASVAVPAVTLIGVPLGLRPDVLIAGFCGALAAIALLNAVPSSGDTWRELLRTTGRRIAFAVASSLTAGYLAPILPAPGAALLGAAFTIGACAQHALRWAIKQRTGASTSNDRAGDGQ
jgi:hypothetical protein